MGRKILKLDNLKKTVRYLKKNGVRHTYYAAKERIGEERKQDYRYEEPPREILEKQREESVGWEDMFSIVVPAYETDEGFLREMLDSVIRQSYSKWELVIVDAGRSGTVRKVVEERSAQTGGRRIKYMHLEENKGIAENTNVGIGLAGGNYIALLDHDDLLAPDALYHMAAALRRLRRQGTEPVLFYTDEDKYDDGAKRYLAPNKKEKFNLDLILSNNYMCHFMAVEAQTFKRFGLRREFDGAQDYDLVLRIIGSLYGKTADREWEQKIVHIPRVLYHWRCHAGSTAGNTASKSYAYEAGRKALLEFCMSQNWNVRVEHSLHLGFYEITYLPDILTAREDVGIVCGSLLDARGRICSGAMTQDGKIMYEGLHKEYSGGSTHRAALKQDVEAADIRCLRVRPELRDAYEQITGLAYGERRVRCLTASAGREVRIADVTGLSCDEAGYRRLSIELGRAAAKRGYRILWDPKMTVRCDG